MTTYRFICYLKVFWSIGACWKHLEKGRIADERGIQKDNKTKKGSHKNRFCDFKTELSPITATIVMLKIKLNTIIKQKQNKKK